MYYTVYKITNLLNAKFYVGVHKTNDLEDDYMGSGTYLKRSQTKYGLDVFDKEYLTIFDNSEDMYSMEKEIVNEAFVKDPNTYNLTTGGNGGWYAVNSTGRNLYGLNGKTPNVKVDLLRGLETQRILRETDIEWKNSVSNKISNSLKKTIDANGHWWVGKNHTNETCLKIKESKTGKGTGSDNPMFHRRWICNIDLKENKVILKNEPIPEGWLPGTNAWLKKPKVKIVKERKIRVSNKSVDKKNLKEVEPLINKAENELYWINQYRESGKSIRAFVRESDFPYSHVTLSSFVKKHT